MLDPSKWSTNLSSCMPDSDFSSSCVGTSQPKNTHISLNMKPFWLTWISTWQKLHLFIILSDDAIKYTCIWLLAWRNKYKPYNSPTPLQWFLIFSLVKEKEKQWRMKGHPIIAEWINLSPLMAKIAIWQFDGKVTWLCFDGDWICFLMHFYNWCAYKEVVTPTENWLLW